jgi:succinate dehydrogenase/fumarate reductase flavoprotein subunit
LAMLATARWATAAARARRESRGLHQREDYRETLSKVPNRLLVSGFDIVQVEQAQPQLEPA